MIYAAVSNMKALSVEAAKAQVKSLFENMMLDLGRNLAWQDALLPGYLNTTGTLYYALIRQMVRPRPLVYCNRLGVESSYASFSALIQAFLSDYDSDGTAWFLRSLGASLEQSAARLDTFLLDPLSSLLPPQTKTCSYKFFEVSGGQTSVYQTHTEWLGHLFDMPFQPKWSSPSVSFSLRAEDLLAILGSALIKSRGLMTEVADLRVDDLRDMLILNLCSLMSGPTKFSYAMTKTLYSENPSGADAIGAYDSLVNIMLSTRHSMSLVYSLVTLKEVL